LQQQTILLTNNNATTIYSGGYTIVRALVEKGEQHAPAMELVLRCGKTDQQRQQEYSDCRLRRFGWIKS